MTKKINGVRNANNTFRVMNSIATLHNLMGLLRTVEFAGLSITENVMLKDAQDFLTNGIYKWIWFVTIIFRVSNVRYKHTCWDYLLPMEMYTDLATLGIVPKKSLVLTWPNALPTVFVNSYLLGILDGDGWITIDQRKRTPYYTLGFMSASPSFLERAALEINAAVDVPLARLSPVNKRAFTIRYGGKSAVLMSNWLHRDIPGLTRKRIPM